MPKALVVLLALSAVAFTPLAVCQDDASGPLFSPEQLDNLLAPIALYPDPLLAQVLLAATFPDQIDEASRFLRANADPNSIDSQPWDVSVKAVAHYPTVLYDMADKLDWTTALGQAYASQSTDAMASVQRLRAQAQSEGNLVTTPQEQVVDSGGYIEIWPEQPQYIYVPVYDPAMVYSRRGLFISFGTPFGIGAWLNYDCDWAGHRIFYHGWEGGGGWIARSRPFVRVSNVYVNNAYRNVAINRTVVNRRVDYNNLNRYNSVHRDANYNNVRANNRPAVNNNVNVNNKVIQRNVNINDPRLDVHRGRAPEQPAYQAPARPAERPAQPAYQAPARPAERPDNSAFGGNRGAFDTHAASQRGQASREQMNRPAPAPAPRASNPPPASREDKGRRK